MGEHVIDGLFEIGWVDLWERLLHFNWQYVVMF